MGKESLYLRETPLREERSWEADGVSVLSAVVTLPQCEGSDHRARRFNRYYRRLCRAYLVYCEQDLLPRAAAHFRAALETSAPWLPMRASLGFRVSCNLPDLLSLYTEAWEENGPPPRITLRHADTWDLRSAALLPISEFFPPRSRIRRTLCRAARAQAQRRSETGSAVYYPDWRLRLRLALSPANYYLGTEGLHFFYPMYSVAPAAEGIAVFTLPYNAAAGPFSPTDKTGEG